MSVETEQSREIRRYLLGELSEAELYRLEARMMVDDDFTSEIGIVEDELVDDYVAGNLSPDERSKFKHKFLRTPQGRQQVSFGMALRDYSAGMKPGPSGGTTLRRLEHNAHRGTVAAWIASQSRLAMISMASVVLLLFGGGWALV